MKTFELRSRKPEEIAFARRDSLEEAWKEWKNGDDVMLTWEENGKIISEIVTPTILEAVSEGYIRLYSVESK
ncbi:MAG: hypothetical protein ACLFSQ_02650 [Candidatus Zixiibacteriota bacterium]